MDAVPAVTPETMPVEPTVALLLPLVHEPPVVRSDNIVVNPAHTAGVPLMLDSGLTVSVAVVLQPEPSV